MVRRLLKVSLSRSIKKSMAAITPIIHGKSKNDLEVSEAHTCEESLEDYFKRVTGGEGIA